jgi:hypothetical protein
MDVVLMLPFGGTMPRMCNPGVCVTLFVNLCLVWPQRQPDELLDLATQACESASGVGYVFEEEHHVGNQHWKIAGTARQARAANVTSIGFTEGLFRFEGTVEQDGKKQAFGLAYDGKKLYAQNPGDAEMNVIEQPTMADVFASVDPRLQMLGVPPLSAAAPFAGAPDRGTTIRAVEVLPDKQIAKVRCELLRVSTSATAPDGTKHEIESTWAFGKDDYLPRMRQSAQGQIELRDLRVLQPEDAGNRRGFRLQREPTTREREK